jgi:hypothetical protein
MQKNVNVRKTFVTIFFIINNIAYVFYKSYEKNPLFSLFFCYKLFFYYIIFYETSTLSTFIFLSLFKNHKVYIEVLWLFSIFFAKKKLFSFNFFFFFSYQTIISEYLKCNIKIIISLLYFLDIHVFISYFIYMLKYVVHRIGAHYINWTC